MSTAAPTLRPGRSRSRDARLEITTEEPDLELFQAEIQEAMQAANVYYRRNSQALDWWYSRWPGQTIDGRKHRTIDEEDPFPWEGASDTRVRSCERLVNEHVLFAKYAYRKARVQAKSVRPLAPDPSGQGTQGGRSERVTQLLSWMIYTHMAGEMRRELPLLMAWRFGYGSAFTAIQWETSNRLEIHKLDLSLLDQLAQQGGGDPMMVRIMEGIRDPDQAETFANLIQQLSPVVSHRQALAIVKDLREIGVADVPVPYVYKSKPQWTALRGCVDILFPDETGDLQAERWVARREFVNEVDLTGRVNTEDYNQAFVTEALKHKGQIGDVAWQDRTDRDRNHYYGGGAVYPQGWSRNYDKLVELVHFHYKAVWYDTPCVYKTVFCPAVVRVAGSKDPLYAKHGLFDYQHGQYPFVAWRRETNERPILSSRGIPEIAYTWEQEEKVQRDARSDRTAIVNRPPMIVPWNKEGAIKGQPLPGAILGVLRPSEVQWMPLPPTDNTPEAVIKNVQDRLKEHFPLFGPDDVLDPDLKRVYREGLSADILGEFEEMLAQTLALMQQYLPDATVTRVVGELARPFHVDREQIQGAYELSATIDIAMVDVEGAKMRMELLKEALQFNTLGNADMSVVFRAAIEMAVPDLAEQINVETQQATNREIVDEKHAFASMMSGDEPQLPMNSNYQLRKQTLIQIIRANPRMGERLAQNPDSMKIIQNRIKFFDNQLQQQQNAVIGRLQTTKTFSKEAPAATTPQLTAGGE